MASVGLSSSRFLDLKALASLEHMRFTTRNRVEGSYSGRHQSRQQGGAGEFVDFREYVEGEDLRRLDWKVLARTGRAYTRLFQDETNLSCTLVLDASASMRFGGRSVRDLTGSKLEYTQYLATALSQVISRQQDQVGLAVLADGLQECIAPGGALGHVAHLQQTIEQIQTRPVTDLAGGLRALFQRLARRGVLMVMSDFLVENLEAVFGAIRLFRHRRWEVVILHLVHPDEERLPEGRAYRFEGLENEGSVNCSPAEIRRLYQDRFEAHAAMVRTLALAGGCDYRRVSTAIPYLQTLGGFLVERSG
ncbi:MAG TPA: DUF58 domain-containing protein [Phycisphaerae bacterium]|jgi:uncharacterized protein (DUF58 family)|nr:DUF58 domain-containing protein [Phycisphaerae bacterium]HOB73377.1 DUF58 domain-containing protein [Phycisphaerae bacterium]HOJ55188.1 DUF58 domain-containing protein [Phycisphaerae bacterium]HOL25019.1 DUF58 domain-containing protein [Phycisphaerae bacterium]HPP20121.1 DUF58 domain-containing protein [Phycisphaerae bacterium]